MEIYVQKLLQFIILMITQIFIFLNNFVFKPLYVVLVALINNMIYYLLSFFRRLFYFFFLIFFKIKVTTGSIAFTLYKLFNYYCLWVCIILISINILLFGIIEITLCSHYVKFLSFFCYFYRSNVFLMDFNWIFFYKKFTLFYEFYFTEFFFYYLYVSFYAIMFLFSIFFFYHILDSLKHIIKDYVKLFDDRLSIMLLYLNYIIVLYFTYCICFTKANIDALYYWLIYLSSFELTIYFIFFLFSCVAISYFIMKLKKGNHFISQGDKWISIKNVFTNLFAYFWMYRLLKILFKFIIKYKLKVYSFSGVYVIAQVFFGNILAGLSYSLKYSKIFPKVLWRVVKLTKSHKVTSLGKYVIFFFFTFLKKISINLYLFYSKIAIFYQFIFFKILTILSFFSWGFVAYKYPTAAFIFKYFNFLVSFFIDYLYNLVYFSVFLTSYFVSFLYEAAAIYLFDFFLFILPAIFNIFCIAFAFYFCN